MSDTIRFDIPQSAIPTQWYNVQADLPRPLPPVLHPGTQQPVGPADLAPLFPMGLIMQEVSQDRWVDIPEEVREIYKLWRPTPLLRARRLEKALDTPAHIYYKYEGSLSLGQPQIEYSHGAGLLQQAGRHQRPDHRDGRRAMGHGACASLQLFRYGMYRLHGAHLV